MSASQTGTPTEYHFVCILYVCLFVCFSLQSTQLHLVTFYACYLHHKQLSNIILSFIHLHTMWVTYGTNDTILNSPRTLLAETHSYLNYTQCRLLMVVPQTPLALKMPSYHDG